MRIWNSGNQEWKCGNRNSPPRTRRSNLFQSLCTPCSPWFEFRVWASDFGLHRNRRQGNEATKDGGEDERPDAATVGPDLVSAPLRRQPRLARAKPAARNPAAPLPSRRIASQLPALAPRATLVCPAMKSAKTARALRLPADYAVWLTALKARVRSAQLRAAARVNRELISLYWDLGRSILRQQQNEGWGAKVVERLAADLKAEFPGMAGFSPLNVWRMRAFYEAYASDVPILSQLVTESAPAIVQQPVARLNTSTSPAGPPIALQPARQLAPGGASPQSAAIVQQPVGQPDAGPPEPMASLPWGHNLLLLHKLRSPADRRWYAQAAVENGWSRSVLAVQIAQRAHRRAGKAVTNFAATLPPPQSDLAQQTLRDPYVFDSEPSLRRFCTSPPWTIGSATATTSPASACCSAAGRAASPSSTPCAT